MANRFREKEPSFQAIYKSKTLTRKVKFNSGSQQAAEKKARKLVVAPFELVYVGPNANSFGGGRKEKDE